ncbi:MAG TPA: GAF domain-containing sensor histidine kinase [Candidatus Omnitrophota bacterium]|nr:GAF domain-containing sensor histidine kinase [Candidatus Omnitrophota bacterium]HPN56764.1 GAF domain-containing sensor histidine kinase [Candidatus Omnitrophota bacterium]
MLKNNQATSFEQFTQSEVFQQIGDICAAVNAVSSARELLETSLKKTLDLFGASRGSIFILDENERDLILKIAQGMEVKEQERMVKRLGEGVVGQVAATKKPIFVADISQDQRFKNYKARSSYKTPSFICAPLLIKDKLIGVISLSDKECGSHFSANELQLLDFLSSQIALNYRRIQLYQRFKTIEEESQTLKHKLGKSSEEASHLKKQVVRHEKLATIGKLTGGIAHEFNNPLDGVMRYTNLCLDHVKDDEVVRGYLLEIKNGLHRMANIVRSLLACSRAPNPSLQKINVNTSLEQALQVLKTDIVGKGLILTKDLAPVLPDVVDLGLERVFTNLLRNAIDASDNGGEIKISSGLMNGQIVFSVSDTGSGISEEKIDDIFEPFFTTKDIEKGCGLGLTIVMEIIKSYDGQINVESALDKGTTFTVTLPIKTKYEL